ncbi:hypothetical protein RE628_06645 [Paenibacillus sp. D2_2]|uniref:hypothetical protein n=1 Tax=Paenibacillus sp. D2_2 TaxID=3073092 RepID=UPI002815F8C8|nr:hypothetical protein [Paenibacillus sp. D2_2]WMT42102.1 hypothetical protein RE628_06645 [Paenibacillus sp. D2_2]
MREERSCYEKCHLTESKSDDAARSARGGAASKANAYVQAANDCRPLVAILSISGLIISLQLQSTQTIARLEDQLQSQSLRFEAVVSDKNAAIERLQNEVISLSSQSQDMMNRMERVSELEDQLQKFIEKYGESDTNGLSNLSSLSLEGLDADNLDEPLGVGESLSQSMRMKSNNWPSRRRINFGK